MKAFTHLNIYHWFIYLVIGAFALHVNAADITPEEALDIANSFVQHDQTAQKAIRKAPKGTKIAPSIAHRMPSRVATNKDNVYIINLGNDQGFVVVSGEDGATAEILGYCDHGFFNYEDAPVQFIDLLKEYSDGIDSLRRNPALRTRKPRRIVITDDMFNTPEPIIGEVVVGPLITTQWNQTAPYNNLCPTSDPSDSSAYASHCYTGCVPTAVAQVMNYWKWPVQSGGQVYVGWSQENGDIYEDFPVHTYDWDNMLDDYDHGYSWEQANAVAQLMADIGSAMGTSYCQSNGSPTVWQPNALIDNFGYEPGIETVTGNKAADIMISLKSELNEKRPVLYVGCPEGEGDCHALVCDGYTKDDYFHFNYGWGGQTDGFYRLSSVPIYVNNVNIWINVRPYDAIQRDIDGIRYGLLGNGTADILEYIGGGIGVNNGTLVIPDSVTDPVSGTTYTVTHIKQMAFYNKGRFDKITLGNNIEAIDHVTFMSTNIDTLVLSDKMEVVPEQAFRLTNIKHLTIGANVRLIGREAFFLCPLNTIVCKSPHVELATESFAHSHPQHGDWEKSIVKINKKALWGATLSQQTDFENLEVLGDSAFSGTLWGQGSPIVRIGSKVRVIATTAFNGLSEDNFGVPSLFVDSLNPYFSSDFYPIIYNKDKTIAYLVLDNPSAGWPGTLLRMEPRSVRGKMYSYTIPQTIVNMDDAFIDCTPYEYTSEITCPHLIPPAISESTFPDVLFAESSPVLYLRVPAGSEDLYANAPGWSKFAENIIAMYDGEFTPLPPQGLDYRMVVHSDSLHTSVPVSDVQNIQVSENTDGDAMVTLHFNGIPDINANPSLIDSLTFRPGFVYEGAEIFQLNDSNRIARGQKASIELSATVFDHHAEMCIRNSVLTPTVLEGVIKGLAVDFRLLTDSGEIHDLSGVAKIRIPIAVGSDEELQAAYFNEQTGTWEPVLFHYDKTAGEAVITTGHLCTFSAFTVKNDYLRSAQIVLDYTEHLFYTDFNTTCKRLFDFMQSKDPEAEAVRKWKDDMGFWQAIGLDGGYAMLKSIGFGTEAMDKITDKLGTVGLMLTILDVVSADINGDDTSVAANTLKAILSFASGTMASAIGTSIMTASMGCVAFIGVGLEKFGTHIQQRKVDLFREAYRFYYSEASMSVVGRSSKYGFNWYRTPKDWFNYFYPAIKRGKMTESRLNAYIEQSVRMYCQRFWDDNTDAFTWCMAEKDVHAMSSYMYPDKATMDKISDEYFAELMHNVLPDVFASIREKLATEAEENYKKALIDYTQQMNTVVTLRIMDSSVQEDEFSPFAGWKIRFTEIPDSTKDSAQWIRQLDDKGKTYFMFTEYALVRNKIPCHLTLSNLADEDEYEYTFTIPQGIKRVSTELDISAGGVDVETPNMPNLKLTYDSAYVSGQVTITGLAASMNFESYMGYYVLFTNTNQYENTNFQTEIEQFIRAHKQLSIDTEGNIHLGNDIVVPMVNGQGQTQCAIQTNYRFEEQTKEQFIENWKKSAYIWPATHSLFNGNMSHTIPCTISVSLTNAEKGEYNVTYTGIGTYAFEGEVLDKIAGYHYDFDTMSAAAVTTEDVQTTTIRVNGTTTLQYTTILRQK